MSDSNAPAGGGTPGLDLEALQKSINETISKAVGARLSRDSIGKQIEEKIAAALGGEAIGKAVEAAIVKMVETAPADAPAAAGTANQPGTPAPAGAPVVPDPKVEALEKQLKALNKRLADADAKASKADADAKAARINAHVETQLLPLVGGNAKLAKLIAKELAGNVEEQAPGTFAWKQGEDQVDFSTGFKAWAGTPEAKELLPQQRRDIPRADWLGTPTGYGERNGQPAGRSRNPLLEEMQRGLNTFAPDPTGAAPSSSQK